MRERYHLVCLKSALEQPPVKALLQALQSPAWAATLAQLPGYSAEGAQSGQVLALRAHLPWWRYRQEKTTHSAQDLKPQKISSRPGK